MARSKSRRMSDSQADEQISQMLIQSGERDRMREKLRRQLEECGWRLQVKLEILEMMNERDSGSKTMDEIIKQMVPKATTMVPDKVWRDLSKDLQKFLEKNAD